LIAVNMEEAIASMNRRLTYREGREIFCAAPGAKRGCLASLRRPRRL